MSSGILSSKENREKKNEHQSELKRSAHVGGKSVVVVHRKSMKKVKEKGLSAVSYLANVSSKITSKI